MKNLHKRALSSVEATAKLAKTRVARGTAVAPMPGVPINRITVEELRERLNRGEPLALVDARSNEAWEKAELQPPGSIRVPPDDVAGYVDRVPKDRAVVTFCT